ncbi:hypothetical protein PR048_022615 [Dryococelus australis]|uniref:MTTase N-terminal domain-containing protein n=1 Tax=Dryococelus australis TaxID=614101 RepID=A0ABQ9H1I9_9NEOP|nr:hypothetical protein PR048_022615 [Dryococelus australis]
MPFPCEEIIGDIEDLISSQKVSVKEQSNEKMRDVTVRAKRRAQQRREPAPESEGSVGPGNYIPGTQTVYVRTWGCAHNNSDSEYMAGQLAAYGYTLTGMLLCSNTSLPKAGQCTASN